MSEHRARISWKKETDSFGYRDYNREHEWYFEGGTVVKASAAPKYLGKPECVDPEEAFVASLSACHMLTFLAICARRGIVVERYEDNAIGLMKPQDRRLVISDVTLRPRIEFAAGHEPDEATISKIHDQSHHDCFLANSVKTVITVE